MKRFSHFTNPGNLDGFTIRLARSGRTLSVPAGSSILYALLSAGVDVPFNCGTGRCGCCEVGVIEGVPDHRDFVLTAEERARNDSVIICCSGSLTDELVLDL